MAEGGGGLVYFSTTCPEGERVPLDSKVSRLRRMKSGTITAARLLQEQMQCAAIRYKVVMVTLTYRDIDGYSPNHIREFLHLSRKFLQRRGFRMRYVWVMELQRRGAPHYHVLLWMPKGQTLPKPDKRGWWPHGFTRIEWTRNAVGYCAKYASKQTDQQFPRRARIHGCGGLSQQAAMERRWWLSPLWVRDKWQAADDVHRAPKGGFVSRVTGEWEPSPWIVVKINGSIFAIKVTQNENGRTDRH